MSSNKKKNELSCLHHGLFLFHGCSSKFSWQLLALLPDQDFTSALLLLEPCDQDLPLSLCSPHETSKNCSQKKEELNQSCVNSATHLQKCLNTPGLWCQFTYCTAFFFFFGYIEEKNQKNSGKKKPVIKVIGTDVSPCVHSPRFYINGTDISRKILVAMFSSSCLKHMDVVKRSKTPPVPHIFTGIFVNGLGSALHAFQKALENKFWCLVLNCSLFPGLAWFAESSGNPQPQEVQYTDSQPICLTTTGIHGIKVIKYKKKIQRLSGSFAYCRQNVLIRESNAS